MQKLSQASENRLWKLTEGGTNPAEGWSKFHSLTFQQLAQTVGNFMLAWKTFQSILGVLEPRERPESVTVASPSSVWWGEAPGWGECAVLPWPRIFTLRSSVWTLRVEHSSSFPLYKHGFLRGPYFSGLPLLPRAHRQWGWGIGWGRRGFSSFPSCPHRSFILCRVSW